MVGVTAGRDRQSLVTNWLENGQEGTGIIAYAVAIVTTTVVKPGLKM